MAEKDPDMHKELLQDGAILSNRKCTDCCMIPVFFIFVIGWIIVGTFAIMNGKPSRIILPENFRGDLCGDTDTDLEALSFLYIPKPSRLSYGFCVYRCPAVLDYVCNNDYEIIVSTNLSETREVRNDYYNHNASAYFTGQSLALKCAFPGLCTPAEEAAADRFVGLLKKINEYKCFMVFYASASTLHRCVPFQSSTNNATLAELAGESQGAVEALSDKLGVGSFFTRGFSETENSWWVIAICCGTAIVLSIIWIFLLRYILAPIIYFCIILIFAALVAVGFFAYWMANDLENYTLPGDTATQDQVKIWRAVQYFFWILAGIYFIAMMWMLKRIRIAIAIMKEGSKAFTDSPSLAIIPPIIMILLLGCLAGFIVLMIYIQTIGKQENVSFRDAAVAAFGETAVNGTLQALDQAGKWANSTLNISISNTSINTTGWTTEQIVKALHAYNFFGFLWVSNFCIMYGFFVMAMTTCVWYFSATTVDLDRYDQGLDGGRMKETARGTALSAFCIAVRYHLGTILWGALCIAIIQFIRALFLYLQEEFLDRWKENATIKCVVYCIDCCLAYIERVVKVVSKTAFIITCVKNTNFCSSAFEAMELLVSNFLRVSLLSFMAIIAHFILKLFIVASNLVIAYFLINMPTMTQGVEIESGLFPLIGIFIITFIIASLFINVFESCTDTVMICFFIDEKDLDGVFMPISLSQLLNNFKDVEMARQDYEKRIKYAVDKGYDEPEPTRRPARKEKEKEDDDN